MEHLSYRFFFNTIANSQIAGHLGVVFMEEDGWRDAFRVQCFAGSVVGEYYDSTTVDICDDIFEAFFKHDLIN